MAEKTPQAQDKLYEPRYLALYRSGELQKRYEQACELAKKCVCCGRRCEADRTGKDPKQWGKCHTWAITSSLSVFFLFVARDPLFAVSQFSSSSFPVSLFPPVVRQCVLFCVCNVPFSICVLCMGTNQCMSKDYTLLRSQLPLPIAPVLRLHFIFFLLFCFHYVKPHMIKPLLVLMELRLLKSSSDC